MTPQTYWTVSIRQPSRIRGRASVRASLVVAVVAVLGLVAATPASASTVDQQQTTYANNQRGIGMGFEFAQTFTAGRTGVLSQVDILSGISPSATPPVQPLLVQIRALSAGTPAGPVLASQTVEHTALTQLPRYMVLPIRFSSPAPVVAGTRYAIVVSGSPAGVLTNNYGLGLSTVDAYPGGEAWTNFDGTWRLGGQFEADWWFRTYVAPWSFTGFLPPINNAEEETVNTVKAGASVPVKFSLDGYKGLDVIAPGYPKLTPTPCDAVAEVGSAEQTTTRNDGLSYSPSTDTYTYVWKTQKRWAGTCGTLVLQLNDGATHSADFTFR